MHFQLYDQGYDIWMGNNRGTKYSNVSEKFPDDDDSFERWDFSYAELGIYDNPAFMDLIMQQTGAPKVTYIGYSMGTSQMFYGLTQLEQTYYGKYMEKFIAIAPCVYVEPVTYEEYQNGYGKWRELGVNVIGGPNWHKHAKAICDNMDKKNCHDAHMRHFWEPEPLKTREWYY